MPNPEISDLPVQPLVSVSDDDLLLIFDTGAVSDKSRQVTVGDFKDGLVREDGDHDLGTSEITNLTSTTATINNLTVTTGLTFDGSDTISDVWVGNLGITLPNITTGASNTQTATLTGITAADFVFAALTAALPDGLTMQVWISASDTVSFKFYNTTGGTINGASYVARTTVIKAS